MTMLSNFFGARARELSCKLTAAETAEETLNRQVIFKFALKTRNNYANGQVTPVI